MDYKNLQVQVTAVYSEVVSASMRLPPFRSEYEGIAVIEEEFLELRQAVFGKRYTVKRKYVEAQQLAAMAMRFMMLLTGGE